MVASCYIFIIIRLICPENNDTNYLKIQDEINHIRQIRTYKTKGHKRKIKINRSSLFYLMINNIYISEIIYKRRRCDTFVKPRHSSGHA